MNEYCLVYKLPDTTEFAIKVIGDNFSDGWLKSGRSEEEWEFIASHFTPRKTKGGTKPGEIVDTKKNKVEKWLNLFYLDGPGTKLIWNEPTKCDETGKHCFAVEVDHCLYCAVQKV